MASVAGRRRPGPKDEPNSGDESRSEPPVIKAPARRRPLPPPSYEPSSPPPPVEAPPPSTSELEAVEVVEVVEPETVEPEAFEPAEPSAPVAPARRRGAVPVIASLLVAVLAAAGWLVYLDHRTSPKVQNPVVNAAGLYTPGTISSAAGAAAVRAAVAEVPVVLAYDYRTLDAGLAKALTDLTPGFASEFTTTFNTVVKPVAAKNKAVVKTLVRAAGLVNQSGSSATVLVFVDEALVSTGATTTPKISQDRVRVTLLKTKGRWLIDSITPF